MITTTIKPIIGERYPSGTYIIHGVVIECRFLGLLIWKKFIYNPGYFGADNWDWFKY